ncbi:MULTISPECIES: glycosyltransferase [Olivibacter]|uniref:Glycosyltransferase n=1 Tax=Olivibacter jilunii TaxID=985016 RepID=A0ABW6BBA7_9SPHI|nr:glycosyltransferase [Olivibacter sp. UJ_SKK_5.1]MDX3912631.1 glycosyltransferase [Pseudosphingobacterium sp.]
MNGNPRYPSAIPAFKASFLAACIHSVLQQRYTACEFVNVNDASPEPMDEIVSSFSDSRIRYYRNNEMKVLSKWLITGTVVWSWQEMPVLSRWEIRFTKYRLSR